MHEYLNDWQRYLLGVVALAFGIFAVLHLRRQSTVPKRWGRPVSIALVAVSVLYLAYLGELAYWLWINAARRDDMMRYYIIANRAVDGRPLYWPWPDYGPHMMTPGHPYPYNRYPYPPFFIATLAPLAKLPVATFARVWYVVLYAGFFAYAASLARLATGRITAWRVAVAAAVLAATPGAQLALMVANVEPVLWALFGLALAFSWARGFGFMASAMVKLYGAWPLLVATSREGWGVLRGAGVALALGVAVCALVLGPATFVSGLLDWARYMVPVVGQGTFMVDRVHGGANVSLSFAGLRVARYLGWDYQPGPLPGWARLYLTLLGIGAPLLCAWVTRRMENSVLRYGLVTIAAVLFAPLCWTTYLPLLLAPLAVAVRQWIDAGPAQMAPAG